MSLIAQKILYGLSETGISAVETFLRLHLVVFYSGVLGIPPLWVAINFGILILWSAAIDPLIGRYSDAFKIQKGTRMHLVLFGAIGSVLCLVALFNPPELGGQLQTWVYLLVLSLVFSTLFGFFSVPYAAMVTDYSSVPEQRAGFLSYRFAFGNMGTLLGIAIPGYYLIHQPEAVYSNTIWILVMLVLFVAFLTSLAPPPQAKAQEWIPSQAHPIRAALANRSFFVLLGALLLALIGLTLMTSLALYYYRLTLKLDEKAIQNSLILFFLLLSFSVPFWYWVYRLKGTRFSLLSGLLLFAVVHSLIYLNLPQGLSENAYFLSASGSGFFLGSLFLLDLALVEIVSKDYGFYFGIWRFASHLARALAVILVGLFLDWANIAFPDIDTPKRLSLLFGPSVGFFFAAAGLILLIFPARKSGAQVQ